MGAKRIDALLADYGANHATRGNRNSHVVGITLIVFGVLSMLHAVPVRDSLTASELLVVAAFLFYLTLDAGLALAVTAVAAVLDLAARGIDDWRVGAAAFVVGWIFQGIGHAVYEKRSPAFFRNLVHLLIGPAFLVNEALHIRPAAPAPR